MTKNEAKKIYENWRESVETLDKILIVFSVIPESFLPYSAEILEEAINIIAKDYFDKGNKKMADSIKGTAAYHMTGLYLTPNGVTGRKITDEEALLSMKKTLDFILENPKLKKATIELLKKTQKNWAEQKQ
jgi:predicted transcriptional regulator